MNRDSLPLLSPRDLAAPLAWRFGQPISGAQFLGEAQALARQLPDAGRPVNLCQDRYLFALGLAAALLRGQTSLMPPNALPQTLALVPADGPAPYLLVDGDPPAGGNLPWHAVQRPAATPTTTVPTIAAGLEAVCLLTSGSTGAPQPHAKRWDQLLPNIQAEASRLAELIDRADLQGLTLVGTVPAQHSYGLESTVLLALLGGAAFDAGRPFYAADIAQALMAVPKPRALVTTPFHLKTLLLAGVALAPVDLVLCATAPLSPQLAALAEARLSGRLVEIYGCTEAGQVASRRTTTGEVWTTLGELRISTQRAPDGEERFIVAGGHVAAPTPLADLLALQDDRHFRLLGRANDLIHVAGKRSSLAHLNFHLNRIEGVDDGAFWLPDEVAESVVRPVAFVVAPGLTSAAITQALRKTLEPAFVPRRVVLVPSLPREATGKLTAAALRRFALANLATAGTAQPQAEWHIGADHPALAGHFPGHPVLPGAVLLSLVMQALARQPKLAARLGGMPRIDQAKFLSPVGPGTTLQVQLREQGAGIAFEVMAGSNCAARGQLSAGAA